MAHWAPILGEAAFLPQIVFPFIIVYGLDELAAFETVMTIMMSWGFTWFATYPNPPVHLVDTFNQLLQLHDNKLFSHLKSIGVSAGLVSWNILSSLFCEIFNRQDWLRLMDFLFLQMVAPSEASSTVNHSLHSMNKLTNISVSKEDREGNQDGHADCVLLTVVAIMTSYRSALLSIFTDEVMYTFFRTQQGAISVSNIIKSIQELKSKTPAKYVTIINPSRYYEDVLSDDPSAMDRNISESVGHAVFPLPQGVYPAYVGFPRSILDWQIKEREKILALDRELLRKESVVRDLEAEITRVERDHDEAMKKYKVSLQRRQEQDRRLMEAEKIHLKELESFEHDITLERLKALDSLTKSSQEEADFLDSINEEIKITLEDKEEHLREKVKLHGNLLKAKEVNLKAQQKMEQYLKHQKIHQTQQQVHSQSLDPQAMLIMGSGLGNCGREIRSISTETRR